MSGKVDRDLWSEVSTLIAGSGARLDPLDGRPGFAELLSRFVPRDFAEAEAEAHWAAIVPRALDMASRLGRPVPAAVAVLDHFASIDGALAEPLLVESGEYLRMERLAMLDGLTGVFNRRYMDMALSKELNRCARYGKRLAVILIDLDDFKRYNDERGHLAGDAALVELAGFLRECVRGEDYVCRYGGEEFLVILPETGADGALMLAERMRERSKARPFFRENGVTFSGGVAAHPEAGATAHELVTAADKALYQAKFAGKDRIVAASAERRRHSRCPRAWLLDVLDSGARERSVGTENVAAGGAKIECVEPFGLDERLNLVIRASGSPDALRARGKVTWIRPKGGDRWDCGLEFTDIPRNLEERFALELAGRGA